MYKLAKPELASTDPHETGSRSVGGGWEGGGGEGKVSGQTDAVGGKKGNN